MGVGESWGRGSSILLHVGNTPMVPLERIAAAAPVPVLAKCEHLNPGGSVKDRIALAIVDAAEESGALGPGDMIVEATAGNTGLGLAMVAAVRGYRLTCVLTEKMSRDKVDALRAVGARVVIAPTVDGDDPRHFKLVAERLAREPGCFLAQQFDNPANPAVHEATTGPEILSQTRALCGVEPAAFVTGAGTGGTLTGVGRFLRRACPAARVFLADPVGSVLGSWFESGEAGEGDDYELEGIGAGVVPNNLERDAIHALERVTDAESFALARRLAREEGLFVGGSAGASVAAALRIAERPEIDGPVVALLPDAWDRYRAKEWTRAELGPLERIEGDSEQEH